jgi:hypothetical protein
MRVLSQTELNRMSKLELASLLRAIVCELPRLREGSQELRDAHVNLAGLPAVLTAQCLGKR